MFQDMAEGKKNLPGEAKATKYPIDVEARLTSLGLYEELERTEVLIKIIRRTWAMLNIAYSLGKAGKPLRTNMVATIQGIATVCKDDENITEIVFPLLLKLYEAYVQGRKAREELDCGGAKR